MARTASRHGIVLASTSFIRGTKALIIPAAAAGDSSHRAEAGCSTRRREAGLEEGIDPGGDNPFIEVGNSLVGCDD